MAEITLRVLGVVLVKLVEWKKRMAWISQPDSKEEMPVWHELQRYNATMVVGDVYYCRCLQRDQ